VEALRFCQLACEIIALDLWVDPRSVSELYEDAGQLMIQTSSYSSAVEYLLKAVKVKQQYQNIFKPVELAATYLLLGEAFVKRFDLIQALESFQKALELRLQHLAAADWPELCICYEHLADVFHQLGKYEECVCHLQKAIAVLE